MAEEKSTKLTVRAIDATRADAFSLFEVDLEIGALNLLPLFALLHVGVKIDTGTRIGAKIVGLEVMFAGTEDLAIGLDLFVRPNFCK